MLRIIIIALIFFWLIPFIFKIIKFGNMVKIYDKDVTVTQDGNKQNAETVSLIELLDSGNALIMCLKYKYLFTKSESKKFVDYLNKIRNYVINQHRVNTLVSLDTTFPEFKDNLFVFVDEIYLEYEGNENKINSDLDKTISGYVDMIKGMSAIVTSGYTKNYNDVYYTLEKLFSEINQQFILSTDIKSNNHNIRFSAINNAVTSIMDEKTADNAHPYKLSTTLQYERSIEADDIKNSIEDNTLIKVQNIYNEELESNRIDKNNEQEKIKSFRKQLAISKLPEIKQESQAIKSLSDEVASLYNRLKAENTVNINSVEHDFSMAERAIISFNVTIRGKKVADIEEKTVDTLTDIRDAFLLMFKDEHLLSREESDRAMDLRIKGYL